MTEAGRRLLAHHALAPDPSVLNLSFALALDGPLTADALAWSIERLGDLYPGLGPLDGGAADVLDARDLRQLPEAERGRAVRDRVRAERTTPFDLDRPPLWRVVVLRLEPLRHALILTWHHAIADGWAVELFAAALSRGYAALVAPAPGEARARAARPARPPRVDAAGAAARRRADRAALASRMAGLAERHCDPFPPRASGALLRWSRSFGAEASGAVTAAAAALAMTPFAYLCGTVARTVCRQYGLSSLLLGTTVLNRRSTADLEAGEARYDGAVIRVGRDGPTAACARAVAGAAEPALPFGDQMGVVAGVTGALQCPEPAVFVLADRHPLRDLRLSGLDVAVLDLGGPTGFRPQEVHSPRCGRVAVFWRAAAGGATLNVFAEAGLAAAAERLAADLLADLDAACGAAPAAGPEPVPWFGGLFTAPVPAVDALSPLTLPARPGPPAPGVGGL